MTTANLSLKKANLLKMQSEMHMKWSWAMCSQFSEVIAMTGF